MSNEKLSVDKDTEQISNLYAAMKIRLRPTGRRITIPLPKIIADRHDWPEIRGKRTVSGGIGDEREISANDVRRIGQIRGAMRHVSAFYSNDQGIRVKIGRCLTCPAYTHPPDAERRKHWSAGVLPAKTRGQRHLVFFQRFLFENINVFIPSSKSLE
ncbi:MAG: hypothetical protein LBI87_07355 [Candidatus Accumulibacter sp.]|jgi:hypothetical protein|nr:hypothetical protein [Accumulibacter sp.]